MFLGFASRRITRDLRRDLAVHTLIMAAYTILEDLSKGTIPYVLYELGLKPHLTAGDMLIVSADIPPQWTISMRLTRRTRLCPCARTHWRT